MVFKFSIYLNNSKLYILQHIEDIFNLWAL